MVSSAGIVSNSRCYHLLKQLLTQGRTYAETARIVTIGSLIVSIRLTRFPNRWVTTQTSSVIALAHNSATRLNVFGQPAHSRNLAHRGQAWVIRAINASWLYRWLTADPEPDVIVIDLRETLAIGPVLRVIERITPRLLPAATRSTLARLVQSLQHHTRTRPLRVCGGLLAGLSVLALVIVAYTNTLSTLEFVGLLTLVLLGLAGTRSTKSWEELQETRVMQAVRTAFEPPA